MTRLPGCHHTKSVMVCKHSTWRKPDSPFIKHSLVFRTHSLALYSYHGSINVGQVSSAIGFDWLWNKYVNTSAFLPWSAQHLAGGDRPPEAICNVLGAPVPRRSLTVKIHGALMPTQKIPPDPVFKYSCISFCHLILRDNVWTFKKWNTNARRDINIFKFAFRHLKDLIFISKNKPCVIFFKNGKYFRKWQMLVVKNNCYFAHVFSIIHSLYIDKLIFR